MSLAKHGFYYLGGRIAGAAIGMLSLFAFTRVLSAEDYGRYSVAIAVSGLIAAVGFQWLRQCLVKFWAETTRDKERLLGTIGTLFSALLVAVAIGAVLSDVLSLDEGHISGGLVIAATAMACAQAWFELTLDAVRVDLKPIRYGAANLARAALCLILGLCAALLTHRLDAILLGVSLGYLLASRLAMPRWLNGLRKLGSASWTETKSLAVYGLPLALTLGFAFVLDSMDQLMLIAMRGPAEAGIYASAYNVAQYSIGGLLAGLGLAVFPLAAKQLSDGKISQAADLLGKNFVFLFSIALPATVGLAVLSPTTDQLLLGNFSAEQSSFITIIVAIGVAFAALRSYALDIVFMLVRKTHIQAALLALSAMLNVVLNVALIPRWGASGAALATLIAFVSAFLLSAVVSRRYLKPAIDFGNILKVVLATAAMSAILLFIPEDSTWASLVVRIGLGAVAYSALMLALNPAQIRSYLTTRFSGSKSLNLP